MNTFIESIMGLARDSGFAALAVGDNWKCLIMIAISCVLLYLAIVKKFEPLLLLPIAFGMLLVNLPLGGVMDYPHIVLQTAAGDPSMTNDHYEAFTLINDAGQVVEYFRDTLGYVVCNITKR